MPREPAFVSMSATINDMSLMLTMTVNWLSEATVHRVGLTPLVSHPAPSTAIEKSTVPCASTCGVLSWPHVSATTARTSAARPTLGSLKDFMGLPSCRPLQSRFDRALWL